jgi:hypothetical protein
MLTCIHKRLRTQIKFPDFTMDANVAPDCKPGELFTYFPTKGFWLLSSGNIVNVSITNFYIMAPFGMFACSVFLGFAVRPVSGMFSDWLLIVFMSECIWW